MMLIDEMEKILDGLAEELPEDFYKQLNGGIILLPQAKQHSEDRASDLFIMGEYYHDMNLGRYIALYYGSIIRVYGHLSNDQLKEQLRKILRHEFRHHLESLAGERGLEIEDEKYISEYLNRFGRKRQQR